MTRVLPLLVLLALLVAAPHAAAALPRTISLQGVLTGSESMPIPDGSYPVTVRLYAAQEGGAALWSETHTTMLAEGVFSLLLGTIAPLDLPFDSLYFAGISLGDEEEMTPRIPLTAVPYSLRAAVADSAMRAASVADDAVTASAIADGAVGAEALADGAVDGSALAPGAVTGPAIADGQVVRQVNGLRDSVVIAAGQNVMLSQSGQTLTISAVLPEEMDLVVTNDDVAADAGIVESKLALNFPTHSNAADPSAGEKAALAGTAGTPDGTNRYVTDADSRLSDARPPAGAAGGALAGTYPAPTIAPATVVRSLNGLRDDVTLAAGANILIAPSGNQITISAAEAAAAWNLGGNAATVPDAHFIGTTDGQPLNVRVNDARALRIEPGTSAGPNLVGGRADNSIMAGVGASVVAGGSGNVIHDTHAVIGGGEDNVVQDLYGVVGGGSKNDATGPYSVVGGGEENRANGNFSTVGGGENNSTGDNYATIGGGFGNWATSDRATVAGGSANRANGQQSTIGGGSANQTDTTLTVIGGGQGNEAFGFGATVGGGVGGRSHGAYSTISGGQFNRATGDYSTVGGGNSNRARGHYSVVCGGGGSTLAVADSNSAAGDYAMIPGGFRNRADGDYSFAAGRRARALHDGTFVWADDTNVDWSSTASRQFLIRTGSVGVNTNQPVTSFHVARQVSANAQAQNHVALIDNTSTGTSTDVLCLRTALANPGSGASLLSIMSGDTRIGGIVGNGSGGVTFQTSGADYAEWLPRLDAAEVIRPGEVVGVYGGRITKRTDGAHHLLVISDRAIVTGNMPSEELAPMGHPVAFVGQVDVAIEGPVREGDVVVASGRGDGLARAMSPSEAKAEDLGRMIGRAWGTSTGHGVRRVLVAVGLPVQGALLERLASIEERVARLEAEMDRATVTSTR